MSPGARHRLIVVLGTALLLAAVAWQGGLLGGGAPRPAPVAPDPARPPGADTSLPVPPVDEATARRLLPRLATNDKIQFDPVAIVLPRPGYSMRFEWPEHPAGHFLMETNDQGFREDGPVEVRSAGLRVLLLGDSHPFGLLDNRDSLANVLETRLAARDAGTTFDVVNAAVSGTGPYEYVGSLRKHLELQPDLVVACLFTGNDFRNALLFADHFAGRERAPPPKVAELSKLPEAWFEPMAQGFSQAFEFRHDPGAAELALAAATDRFLELSGLCTAAGIPLLAVLLPTKPDVDQAHDRATMRGILAALGMTPEDYGINRRLGLRFAAALRERGIPVVDPFEAMRAVETPLYWAKDYHLAVAGHALVAQQLEQPVLELLGRQP